MSELYYKENKPLKNKPGHYINVATNMEIKDLHKKGFKYFRYDGHSLCGTVEAIDEFLSFNDIDENIKFISPDNPDDELSDFEIEYEEKRKKKVKNDDDNIVIPRLNKTDTKTKKESNSDTESTRKTKKESNSDTEKETDTETEIIRKGIINSGLNNDDINEYIPEPMSMNKSSISNLSFQSMKKLCPFELTGIKCEAKLYQISTANNIELAVEIKLANLATERPKGKNNDMKSPIITKYPDASFITIFNCKMYDVEVPNSNTIQGQLCTLLLENYIRDRLNDLIYIEIKGFDNGRMLVKICADKNYKEGVDKKLENIRIVEITQLLTEANVEWDKNIFEDERNLEFIAKPSSLQKDFLLQNYPHVNKGFISRINHGHLLSKYALD
jgi:hypothetical protein